MMLARTLSLPPPCSATPCPDATPRSSSDAVAVGPRMRPRRDSQAWETGGKRARHDGEDGEVASQGIEAVAGYAERAWGRISPVRSLPFPLFVVLTQFSAVFCDF